MAAMMALILPLCVFFTRADVGLWGRALAAETKTSDNNASLNASDTPSEDPATPDPADEAPVEEPEPDPVEEPEPEPEPLEPAATVSFAVLTDLQGETSNAILYDDRLKNQTATIYLGDLIEDNEDNNQALNEYNNIKNNIISTINENTVTVIGNHDNNSHEFTGYIQKSSLAGENGKTYGYVDYDAARLRLIYVDTSDYEMFHGANDSAEGNYPETETCLFTWNNTPYISLRQLHDVAEYLSSTPENYSVVITGHYPTLGSGSWVNIYNGETYGFSIKPLISLIRAYNNHEAMRITYSDYTVDDGVYWWYGADYAAAHPEMTSTTICTPTLGPGGNGKLHADYVSEYDEQGYIDVDFTENTTNSVMAYIHGHTHNFTSTQAHRILGETTAVYDFVELGMAAASANGKGSTDWNDGQSATWNYTSEEGCSDTYSVAVSKKTRTNVDWTIGQHASIVTINTDEKSIYVQNISTGGTGFDRSAICDLSSTEYGVKRIW